MSDYLMASLEEKARLQLQARVWESQSEAMLDTIGIQTGWICLDVGCGAMGILGPLSRRVGLPGKVVGLDADASHLNAARAYIADEGLTNVALLQGDAQRTGLPPESFDLVHERWVLPYVDVDRVIQELITLAKPGGIIVLEETDQASWNYYPELASWPRFKDIIEAGFGVRGDINIGRRTYGLLRDAGLQDVTVRAGVVALQNSHPYMRLPIMGVRAMWRHILDNDIATETELNQLVADLEGHIAQPETFAVMFTLIQVWGRKPQ